MDTSQETRTFSLLGHTLVPTPGLEGKSWDNAPSAATEFWLAMHELSWPAGNPRKWFCSCERLSTQGPAWRIEGPFEMTPEEAVAAFERAWDDHLGADLRRKGAAS